MPIHISRGISYVTSEVLENQGIMHGFFMRHGGCSPRPWNSLNMATSVGDSRGNVIENRKRIADSLSIKPSSFFDLWQIHSNKIVMTSHPRKLSEAHIQADAIVTDKSEVALLMLFADCVPMIFFDTQKRVIAIAHAGWKGTLNGISGDVVKAMVKNYLCLPKDIIAVIGPTICWRHYQIGGEVYELAEKMLPNKEEIIFEKDNKTYLDLASANKHFLERSGINNIETLNICTVCNNDDWFSHRGENGKTGRFAAVILL